LASYFGTAVERPQASGTSRPAATPAGSGVTVILGQDEERSFNGNPQGGGGGQGGFGSPLTGSTSSTPTPRRATPRPSVAPTPPPAPTLLPTPTACPLLVRCP